MAAKRPARDSLSSFTTSGPTNGLVSKLDLSEFDDPAEFFASLDPIERRAVLRLARYAATRIWLIG